MYEYEEKRIIVAMRCSDAGRWHEQLHTIGTVTIVIRTYNDDLLRVMLGG